MSNQKQPETQAVVRPIPVSWLCAELRIAAHRLVEGNRPFNRLRRLLSRCLAERWLSMLGNWVVSMGFSLVAIFIISLCQAALAAPRGGKVVAWGASMTPTPGTVVTNIAVGNEETLGIQSDGTLLSWGGGMHVSPLISPNYYQFPLPMPSGLTNVVAAAVSKDLNDGYAVVLRADGTVFAWGDNGAGQTNVPAGLFNVRSIAVGGAHNLAINGDGTVVAWGSNGSGQTNVPVGLSNVVGIAAGAYCSLALTAEGAVVAWGGGSSGETNVPSGLSNVVAIAAGWDHCLALKSDGTVVAWGNNTHGEATVPPGLSNVVAIAAGGGDNHEMASMTTDGHSLALKSDGTVVAWGKDDHGQADVPVGLSNVVQIAAGSQCSLVLSRDGTAVGWGANWGGQTMMPPSVRDATAVAAFGEQIVVLIQDGTVTSWGADYFGSALPPKGLSNIIAVSPNLALKSDDSLVAWEFNTNVPSGFTNVVAIANSAFDSIALRSDGTVSVWGDNTYGQTNVPPGLSNVVQVAQAYWFELALLADSTVVAWGDDTRGAVSSSAALTNVSSISAGTTHALALLKDGTVTAWGSNAYGQTNVPAGLSNVVAVSCGGYHSLALQRDGTVIGWGLNASGQTTIPTGLRRVFSISGGMYSSVALVRDLEINSTRLNAGKLELRFSTFVGERYVIQRSSDLRAGSWLDLADGNLVGDGGEAVYTDAQPAAGTAFYRIRLVP